jgi:hypothetical protein
LKEKQQNSLHKQIKQKQKEWEPSQYPDFGSSRQKESVIGAYFFLQSRINFAPKNRMQKKKEKDGNTQNQSLWKGMSLTLYKISLGIAPLEETHTCKMPPLQTLQK